MHQTVRNPEVPGQSGEIISGRQLRVTAPGSLPRESYAQAWMSATSPSLLTAMRYSSVARLAISGTKPFFTHGGVTMCGLPLRSLSIVPIRLTSMLSLISHLTGPGCISSQTCRLTLYQRVMKTSGYVQEEMANGRNPATRVHR